MHACMAWMHACVHAHELGRISTYSCVLELGVSGQEGVVLPDNSDGNDIGALRGVLASVERVRAAAETDWAALFPSTLPNDGAAAEGDDKNESVRAKGDEDEQQALLRGKLTTALAELGRGLVEREMEVRTCHAT